MTDLFKDIKEFHEKFGLEYNGSPRHLPLDTLGRFRTKFMGEELAEYITPHKGLQEELVFRIEKTLRAQQGMEPQTLEKEFDALIDLVYVALGTAYLQGFNFNAGWERVHAANMKKVRAQRAEDSARGSTFDVVKPEGWKAPDLSDLVDPNRITIEVNLPDHVVWGAGCSWWDTIDKAGKNEAGLPCCPHCRSVLFEMPKSVWDARVEGYDKALPGYAEFVTWTRDKCAPGKTLMDRKEEYEAETGKKAGF